MMLADQLGQILITGTATAGVFMVGAIWKVAQDMFQRLVLHQPTISERIVLNNIQMLNRHIDLQDKQIHESIKVKNDIKTMVGRSVDDIVALHQECAKDVNGYSTDQDRLISLHNFKAVGESLKLVLFRYYMDSVDINGFTNKSPGEWNGFLITSYNTILSKSKSHYSLWYTSNDFRLDDIMDEVERRKSDFIALNNDLLTNIKDKDIDAEKEQAEIKKEKDLLFKALTGAK